MKNDDALDSLLALDGVTLVVDERLGFWVKFVVRRVPRSEAVPHGVSYSLTLHHRSGERLLGFDNAHRVGKELAYDHWHRHGEDAGRKYPFSSPYQLLADFWQQVDRILKEQEGD